MPIPQRELNAFHKAGHALAGHLGGTRFHYVTVELGAASPQS
jgi:hypothetical protein